LRASGGAFTIDEQEDAHSVSIQRAYNFLCLAYGSPLRADFKELADQWLPERRKNNCDFEYLTVKRAFDLTLKPRLDPVLLEKVKAMRIFQPEDFK
jgi:hypothetical protein